MDKYICEELDCPRYQYFKGYPHRAWDALPCDCIKRRCCFKCDLLGGICRLPSMEDAVLKFKYMVLMGCIEHES